MIFVNERAPAVVTPVSYLRQLDGLRAVAVVLVLVHHFVSPSPFGGWVGVYIFFTLSGYLITSLLIGERKRTGKIMLGRFYLRRALRLYPPLLTAIVVLAPLGIATVGLLGYLRSTGIAATYLTNIYVMLPGHGLLGWSHTWTLAVEEQFYFIWPMIFLWAFMSITKFWLVRVWILGALAAASVLAASFLYSLGSVNLSPALTFGALISGCVLALARDSWFGRVRASHGMLGAIIIAVSVGVGSWEPIAGLALALSTAGSLLLIAHLASGSGPLHRVLSIRPLAYIGTISYELYLWHFPILMYPTVLFGVTPGAFWWIALPATFAFAALSHKFISVPLTRRWKPRLSSWGEPQTVPLVPPLERGPDSRHG